MAATVHHQVSPHEELGGGFEDVLNISPGNSPPPGQEAEPPYRCPVSTPANFVHPTPRVRRTKPMPISLEISLTPASPTKRSAGGRPTRATGTHRSLSNSSNGGKVGSRKGKKNQGMANPDSILPNTINSRTLDYYYVDKVEEQKEEAQVNTFWLRTLCAQPVHEILDKYRRRTELRRTRLIWTKTYTTPGERSLLRAWERNASRNLSPPVRGFVASTEVQHLRQLHSKTHSEKSSVTNQRRHRSEPPLSHKYYSEDGESEDEGSQIRPAGSTVSGNVSVSTSRFSLDQRSASMPVASPDRSQDLYRQEKQQAQQHQRQNHQQYIQQQQQLQQQQLPQDVVAAADAAVAHHHKHQQPTQPEEPVAHRPPLPYAMSDHFRVSLPEVNNNKQMSRRKGTPTVRKKELWSSWNGGKQKPLTPDQEEAPKSSRSATSNSTQPTTPRQNKLPSIS